MGFFLASGARSSESNTRPSNELLHRLECKACPHNHSKLETPKMEPWGPEDPKIYFLAEAPGQTEDEEGKQLVGKAGNLLWEYAPRYIKNEARRNNVIRCHPPNNRDPEKIEIEACRPSIIRDIENTRPDAIFGLGHHALGWVANNPGTITDWRGRRFPVKIGNHTCWYYAFLHPSALLHWREERGNGYVMKSKYEFAFEMDLKKAIEEVEAGLPKPIVHTSEQARENITCLTGRSSNHLSYLLEFLEYAGSIDTVGVDYETSELRPYRKTAKILTAAVSAPDETVSFAVLHREAGWSDEQLEKIHEAWRTFLLSKSRKVSHSLHFEMEWSAVKYGLEMAWGPNWVCSQNQAYVLDERSENKEALSLDFLGLQYFGLSIKDLTKGLKKNNMGAEPLGVLLPYNGIDAKYHRLLDGVQTERLHKEDLWEQYIEKVEQVPTAVLCQIKGIPIDKEENERQSKDYEQKIKVALGTVLSLSEAEEFKKLTGKEFNPGSSQDVIVVLRDILKTRVGQPGTGWSTTEKVLREVDHPLLNSVIDYRKVTKLKSTYTDPYSEGASTLYPGGIIHTNLGTIFTDTGRCNSEDPNVQNIPRRSAEGKKVRRQFKSKEKGLIAAFDLGQIDARGIACASRDKAYCTALWEDFDIHMDWTERLCYEFPQLVGGKKNLKDKAVMKKYRGDKVKNDWVFALFYGAAISTTAGRFGLTVQEVTPLYDQFWQEFAGVKDMQKGVTKQFNELGYVQLFDGLRRRAPIGHGQAINTGIQGATQRIIMNGANNLSKKNNPLLQPNLQIHDELLYWFDTENDFYDSADTIIDTVLDQSIFKWICVPIVVELKLSYTDWSMMEEIDVYSSNKRLNWPIREKEFS